MIGCIVGGIAFVVGFVIGVPLSLVGRWCYGR